MTPESLITVMTVFVIIAALALVIQAGMLVGLYRSARAIEQKVDGMMPRVNSILAAADATLAQSKQQVVEITVKANAMMTTAGEMLETARVQLRRIDGLVNDASERARAQMERAELVLDDTVSRIHESVAIVHEGINRPLREVAAVVAGFRAALAFLTRGSRPTVAQVTQDEEMFI